MRIVSLIPSATEKIARVRLVDFLVGRSIECTYQPEIAALPIVIAARIDPREAVS